MLAHAEALPSTRKRPLAARCVAKDARVLDAKGRVHSDSSIGSALAMRDLMNDLRQAGNLTGGPAPKSS